MSEESVAAILSAKPALIPSWYEDRAGAEAVLARVLAGEDTPDAIKAVGGLLMLHSHHSREVGELAGIICRSRRAGPRVRGAVLRRVMPGGKGKMDSPLAIFPRQEVLRWLASASPLTLMDDPERELLASLPDPIVAWRGGRGDLPRRAAIGLSWTLDQDRARWFAERWRPEPALVVTALFPKSAVVAYFDDRDERELVVNWRRARNLRSG